MVCPPSGRLAHGEQCSDEEAARPQGWAHKGAAAGRAAPEGGAAGGAVAEGAAAERAAAGGVSKHTN